MTHFDQTDPLREDQPNDIAGVVEVEFDVNVLLAVLEHLDDAANGEFDGDAGDEDEEETDEEGGGAPAKGGQGSAVEGLSACGAVGVEEGGLPEGFYGASLGLSCLSRSGHLA